MPAGNDRRVSKAAIEIFDKYVDVDQKARHLKRDDAVSMLQAEFQLETAQAGAIFDIFDKDRNGIMSVWEFEQFHKSVGENAQGWVEKFRLLDKDNSGMLDFNEASAGLKQMQSGSGHSLGDKEIAFFLKTAANEQNLIDLGSFVELLYRLKAYKKPEPKRKQ